jgi:predicted acyltransferase
MSVAILQASSEKPGRLKSLDQFRGYTIAGMFLVNFLGAFYAAPYLFGHHLVFCSYADTIMPHFFFAVGFSMRLSWSRRTKADGLAKTYWHSIQRSLALAVIAILWYGGRPHLPEGVTFRMGIV